MLIKDIVDFENFFHKEFYKSKYNVKQLCKKTGFSQTKLMHWLDLIGPGVTLLDVLNMADALGFYVSIEKIGEVNIPSVWAGDLDTRTATSTTVSSVTDGTIKWLDTQGKILIDRGDKILKALKKSKKSSKKGR